MNLTRLKYFIAVAETGSFSEAAEQLYTTQSTVSKQIVALEKELNTRLFSRTSRKTELTPQGLIALDHAKTIIDNCDAMISSLAAYENRSVQSLSIASIPVMAQYHITSILAEFSQKHPAISLNVEEVETLGILPGLENHQFDLAFMRREMLDGRYDTIDLCADRLAAVLPPDHPLSESKELSLIQLKEEPFLLLNKETMLYSLCMNECIRAGFTPKVAYTGTRMENIVELAARGMGVSLMMEKAVSYLTGSQAAIIPLKEPVISHISLIHLKKRKMTPAANKFWNYVQSSRKLP